MYNGQQIPTTYISFHWLEIKGINMHKSKKITVTDRMKSLNIFSTTEIERFYFIASGEIIVYPK